MSYTYNRIPKNGTFKPHVFLQVPELSDARSTPLRSHAGPCCYCRHGRTHPHACATCRPCLGRRTAQNRRSPTGSCASMPPSASSTPLACIPSHPHHALCRPAEALWPTRNEYIYIFVTTTMRGESTSELLMRPAADTKPVPAEHLTTSPAWPQLARMP